MGIVKFMNRVKESLGLDGFEKSSKKKSIKSLLKKLNKRREDIVDALKEKVTKKEKKELHEELEIVCLHIKKGKKLLKKLNS